MGDMTAASTGITEQEKVSIRARIRSKVEVCPTSGCWNWTEYKTHKGYARIQVKRRNLFAHRVSYFVFNGEINWRSGNRPCLPQSRLRKSGSSRNRKQIREHEALLASASPKNSLRQRP